MSCCSVIVSFDDDDDVEIFQNRFDEAFFVISQSTDVIVDWLKKNEVGRQSIIFLLFLRLLHKKIKTRWSTDVIQTASIYTDNRLISVVSRSLDKKKVISFFSPFFSLGIS